MNNFPSLAWSGALCFEALLPDVKQREAGGQLTRQRLAGTAGCLPDLRQSAGFIKDEW